MTRTIQVLIILGLSLRPLLALSDDRRPPVVIGGIFCLTGEISSGCNADLGPLVHNVIGSMLYEKFRPVFFDLSYAPTCKRVARAPNQPGGSSATSNG